LRSTYYLLITPRIILPEREKLLPMRALWRPELRTGGEGKERHSTWLKAFFDLVFAAAVAQVAIVLKTHRSGFSP